MIAQTNEVWANATVESLPARWCARLLGAWEKRRSTFNPEKLTGANEAQRNANVALRDTVARLLTFAVNDQLPLDASDADVCNVAWNCAEACRVLLIEIQKMQEQGRIGLRAAGIGFEAVCDIEAAEARGMLAEMCAARGIESAAEKCDDAPAVRRMVAARWWTGQLRKAQARAVESAAIELGFVNVARDCYVSNESLEARARQNDRNRATLESTIARNLETKQEFTLAELAAKGPADKAIRRAELMTRINGFERVAIDMAHSGAFFTMTCPSEMHPYPKVGTNRVRRNGRYDGTKPHEAQAHLSKVWARIRAKLDRHGVRLYGFRIAEPNHDGTPHWHCLMFAAPVWPSAKWHAPLLYPKRAAMPRIAAIVRRYALEIPGDDLTKKKVIVRKLRAQGFTIKAANVRASIEFHEAIVAKRARENAQKGAKEHRVDWKPMDPEKGTAAGYIAKYVAKNIDGYRLEKDLYGNDSIEASARVEAWASRWRIRQFQQVGGPPVSVWRELRRVDAVPADSPAFVRQAHNAVNKVAVFEGRDNASVAWNHYVDAQGGVFCGRNYRVRLAKVQGSEIGAYGEEGAQKIVGIEYFEAEAKVRDRSNTVQPDGTVGNWIGVEPRTTTIDSKRYTWEIRRPNARATFGSVRGASSILSSAATTGGRADLGLNGIELPGLWLKGEDYEKWAAKHPGAAREWESGLERAQRAPWTRVNNCTRNVRPGVADPVAQMDRSNEISVSGEGDGAKWGQWNL